MGHPLGPGISLKDFTSWSSIVQFLSDRLIVGAWSKVHPLETPKDGLLFDGKSLIDDGAEVVEVVLVLVVDGVEGVVVDAWGERVEGTAARGHEDACASWNVWGLTPLERLALARARKRDSRVAIPPVESQLPLLQSLSLKWINLVFGAAARVIPALLYNSSCTSLSCLHRYRWQNAMAGCLTWAFGQIYWKLKTVKYLYAMQPMDCFRSGSHRIALLIDESSCISAQPSPPPSFAGNAGTRMFDQMACLKHFHPRRIPSYFEMKVILQA